MHTFRAFLLRLAGTFHKGGRDRALSDELESHLQMHIEDNLQRGMTPAEARRQALIKLGGVEQIKESYRERHGIPFLETLFQDVRFAFRMLRKSPGFTAVAVLTLALGIGANTAIFSVINAVLLRSLPVKDPQQLVVLNWTAHQRPKYHGHSSYGDCDERRLQRGHEKDCVFSVPFFKTVRAQSNTFSGMAAFAGPLDIDFSGNGPATMASGTWVSGDFFSTLGISTVLGRPLDPSDDSPSASPAIVLSYAYWQRAFGGDRSAIGRTVRLNNMTATIVGVTDPHFTNLTPGKTQDFFMPLSISDGVRSEWWGTEDRLSDAASWWVVIVGRLRPGVSTSQAQAAATTIFRNEMLHGAKAMSTVADAPAIKLSPAREGLNGESSQIAPMLYPVMIAVGFVLLIACANVAGLMLARSTTRQKEMAVRLALGAGRARITRQLLTESVLLSAIGGALGILVAVWGVQATVALLSSGYGPFSYVVEPDWHVLAFTIGVTLAAGILFGLAPALRGTRVDLTPSLKESASSLPGAAHTGRRFRLGDSLVITQVALSMIVLVGAGLLVRTLRNLHNLDPGFDVRNILLFGIDPAAAGYKDAQAAQLYRDLQQRFAAIPGVLSVSYSKHPLLSGGWSGDDVHLDDAPPKSNINPATLTIGPDFFSTMRISVLAGRTFSPADFAAAAATEAAKKAAEAAAQKTAGASSSPRFASVPVLAGSSSAVEAPPVPVLVNEMFARKFFPNQNAVGKHMGDPQGDEPPVGPQPGYRIVGIVANAKYKNLQTKIIPTMFLPLVSNSAHFELRTAADPTALVKLVGEVISRADNNLPLFDVRTQTEQIEQTLFQERLMSRLSSFFGALALVLACIGLYGLLSYEVARRTRELGIRMALGAQQRDLLRLVVGQGILLVLIGAAIGIAAAMGVTRFMTSMLYGVHANDPLTIVGVAILLTLVALLACYIPARRAMRVDPMVALRYE